MPTEPGNEALLLMEEILHQLIGSLSQLFIGFHASQVVVWDFSHQQYQRPYLIDTLLPVTTFCESSKSLAPVGPGPWLHLLQIYLWTQPRGWVVWGVTNSIGIKYQNFLSLKVTKVPKIGLPKRKVYSLPTPIFQRLC